MRGRADECKEELTWADLDFYGIFCMFLLGLKKKEESGTGPKVCMEFLKALLT